MLGLWRICLVLCVLFLLWFFCLVRFWAGWVRLVWFWIRWFFLLLFLVLGFCFFCCIGLCVWCCLWIFFSWRYWLYKWFVFWFCIVWVGVCGFVWYYLYLIYLVRFGVLMWYFSYCWFWLVRESCVVCCVGGIWFIVCYYWYVVWCWWFWIWYW